MKIKYEVEADENGYTERITVDGAVKHESKHSRTQSGARQVSGDSIDESVERDEAIDALADDLPTFLGLSMMRVAEEFSA